MKKGIVFSFEALIALLFFATILINMPFGETNSLKELLLLQQENDLLKVWSTNFPSEGQMILDAQTMFDNFELFINGKKIYGPALKKNSIASEAIIVDDNLIEKKINIVVYFD